MTTLTADKRASLIGRSPDAIADAIAPLPGGDRRFRGRQIYHWLHARRVESFEAMTNLPLELRRALADGFHATALTPVEAARSRVDPTVKLVLGTRDGAQIETVRIATPKRVTVCISSQVGCGFGCSFCRTARMGLGRNLEPAEIVDQLLQVHRLAPLPERYNVVFMGMGEPLANYDNVIAATDALGHPDGLHISPRRITVSTVGLAPEIRRLATDRPGLRLAVSLSATTDDGRSALMPIGRRYPLAMLFEAIEFHARTTGKRVTFEYVMLKGVNDSLADAKRLARLANRVPSKINLIPYNGAERDGMAASDRATIETFVEHLYPRTYAVTVRATQGNDIMAACGQLARLPDHMTPRSDPRVTDDVPVTGSREQAP